jgi:hypothetical protein
VECRVAYLRIASEQRKKRVTATVSAQLTKTTPSCPDRSGSSASAASA